MTAIKVDLDDFLFKYDPEKWKNELVKSYGSDIADPIIEDLESENLFKWVDLFYENSDDILETDNVIGTKDLELDELLDRDEVMRLLIESDDSSYLSGIKFSSILYTGLANQIDKRFDTSEEYVDYLIEKTDQEIDKEEFLDKINSGKLGVPFIKSDLDSELARVFDELGFYFQTQIPGWNKDDIGSYNYLIKTVTKNGYDEGGKIVFKIENTITDNIMLSDILEDVEENSTEDEIIDTYISYIECYVITYDSIVIEMYENHRYATKDKNELCKIDFTEEESVEFYNKNPLPL